MAKPALFDRTHTDNVYTEGVTKDNYIIFKRKIPKWKRCLFGGKKWAWYREHRPDFKPAGRLKNHYYESDPNRK